MAKLPHTRAAMRVFYAFWQVAELAAGYRYTTRSISGAHRVVLDSESGLDVFHLPLTKARARHSPCPDDSARDDSVLYTRGAHARATLPQIRSAATGTPPSRSAPTAPRRRSNS